MIATTRASVTIAAALLLAVSASLAFAQAPAKVSDGVLVNDAGMTLYTFDKDAGGKSACNGPCAANWPPLTPSASATASGDWSIITRDDGTRQWAYKGKRSMRGPRTRSLASAPATGSSTTSGTSPSLDGLPRRS